jgi:hypothetical protein
MTARTVLHGIDQSCPDFASRPANAPAGMIVYQEDMKNSWIFDDALGDWVPNGPVAFKYDFTEHGGDRGTIEIGRLLGAPIELAITGADLTAGTIIVHLDTFRGQGDELVVIGGLYQVARALESEGSAQIGIQIDGEDLLAAESIATAGTAGAHDMIPRFSSATAVRVNAPAEAGSPSPSLSLDVEPSPSPSLSSSEAPY